MLLCLFLSNHSVASFISLFVYFQRVSRDKVRLSGYGVELAVKNTEYKAVDDSKIQGDDDDDTVNKDNEDENDIDGFLFGKLRYSKKCKYVGFCYNLNIRQVFVLII